MYRIYFEPYGCTMNYAETREMRTLVQNNLPYCKIVTDPNEADILVIVTCTVIQATENKMLRRLKEWRACGKPIIVAGCMAKAQPERIRSILEGMEGEQHQHRLFLLAPTEFEKIVEVVKSASANISRRTRQNKLQSPTELLSPPRNLYRHRPYYWDAPASERAISSIPIAQGCLGSCSYCITRLARGRLKSYKITDIVAKVATAVKSGYREIQLTAQDTGVYGVDDERHHDSYNLPTLISTILDKVEGNYKLRIGMMTINSFLKIADELLPLYNDHHLFKFLHLPVQSGSEKILAKMCRNYSPADFIEAVDRFRHYQPLGTLATDVIVGFPTETDTDFEATVALINKVRPAILNIKRYSERPKTPAVNLQPKVSPALKKARSRQLTTLQFQLSKLWFEQFVGNEYEAVVLEEGKQGTVLARIFNYAQVVIPDPERKIKIGSELKIKCISSTPIYIIGRIITNYQLT